MTSEKREKERYEINQLPECLKIITFSTGLFSEFSAETVNASEDGMSLISEGVSLNDITPEQHVTVKIAPPFDYKLKAKVIYTHSTESGGVKFGLSFDTDSAHELYQKMLHENLYRQ